MHKDYGMFCWYELMTPDVPAAERFYASVVGWSMRDSGMKGMDYILAYAGESQVAGLMTLPAEAEGMPPMWMGYIFTDRIEETLRDIEANGGKICRQPQDIPGIGRFAVASDPHGAVFSLFSTEDEGPDRPAMMTPGHIGWNELMAGDLDSAWDFYARTFGWTKDTAVDMSDAGLGTYQTFAVRGGDAIGGMMTNPPGSPMPFWGYYFVVEGLDAAGKRVTDGGGQIVMGPMEVPGGAWILNCVDPQGAFFSLVAMAR
ncbi:VOC family protein [Shinella yambaruensis]|uniref:Glyoxalase n=1 Tax=Shinella yambaruensis TaxID=415996 RepID=A0ABQ5ZI90_9HYPH|nr:VOC family protein [Shinella yambaruensis]MCJ8026868.1 VOC family protein [Shinella yambaruensis]MCU7983076.1 VOC family protein [Shinella yambaruensis]GLR51417.1 glyoxalase [Shinella yambaruensis]